VQKLRIPKYAKHKSGQARVRFPPPIGDIYLGEYDTPESRTKYDKLIADYLAGRPIEKPEPAKRGPRQDNNVPALCRHAATGRGYATVQARPIYFGGYGTEECQRRYAAFVAEWLANNRILPGKYQNTDRKWIEVGAKEYLLFIAGEYATRRVRASAETIRRLLHRHGLVWRRPRPVPGKVDPQRDWKLRKIRELLRDLPPDEAAVFQDEVDLNLNPKIGCCWMERGEQAQVVTPGDNVKRYLGGSMSWRTGELIVTEGTRRNAELFVRHLDDLRRAFRRYRVIHVILDNARFHTPAGSRLVRQYLAEHGDRVLLHYLPAYSPNDNPVERVWWHLHERITRNHRCESIDELVGLAMRWLGEHGSFKIGGAMYQRLKAAAA
jgi:transposase